MHFHKVLVELVEIVGLDADQSGGKVVEKAYKQLGVIRLATFARQIVTDRPVCKDELIAGTIDAVDQLALSVAVETGTEENNSWNEPVFSMPAKAPWEPTTR